MILRLVPFRSGCEFHVGTVRANFRHYKFWPYLTFLLEQTINTIFENSSFNLGSVKFWCCDFLCNKQQCLDLNSETQITHASSAEAVNVRSNLRQS